MNGQKGNCAHCDAPLFADSQAWGGLTCGACIAAQIQLSLMGGIPGRAMRPARRADQSHSLPDEIDTGTDDRRTA